MASRLAMGCSYFSLRGRHRDRRSPCRSAAACGPGPGPVHRCCGPCGHAAVRRLHSIREPARQRLARLGGAGCARLGALLRGLAAGLAPALAWFLVVIALHGSR
jgi:hypothetical protein